jgi:hypothetical protein
MIAFESSTTETHGTKLLMTRRAISLAPRFSPVIWTQDTDSNRNLLSKLLLPG